MTESAPDVLLDARGISKSFPGVRALDGVRITVRRGRLNALLGENGAGKSTLMNILAGVFPPDAGRIVARWPAGPLRNPREAQDGGIAIIFQELNLIPHLTRRGEHLPRPRAAEPPRPDRLSRDEPPTPASCCGA